LPAVFSVFRFRLPSPVMLPAVFSVFWFRLPSPVMLPAVFSVFRFRLPSFVMFSLFCSLPPPVMLFDVVNSFIV